MLMLIALREFVAKNKTLVLYVVLLVALGLAVLFCVHSYNAKLKEQYDSGYANAVVATDVKWQKRFDAQKATNDNIVNRLLQESSARATAMESAAKVNDSIVKKLLDAQTAILARDKSGTLLRDAAGKTEQCYSGKDFADAWNKINSTYGLDK